MNLPNGFTVINESKAHLLLSYVGSVGVSVADELLECGVMVLQADHTFRGCNVSCIKLSSLKDALALPTLAVPQPPVLLPDPPSHEQGYANNLTEALRERNKYRDALARIADETGDSETSAYAQLILDGVL